MSMKDNNQAFEHKNHCILLLHHNIKPKRFLRQREIKYTMNHHQTNLSQSLPQPPLQPPVVIYGMPLPSVCVLLLYISLLFDSRSLTLIFDPSLFLAQDADLTLVRRLRNTARLTVHRSAPKHPLPHPSDQWEARWRASWLWRSPPRHRPVRHGW